MAKKQGILWCISFCVPRRGKSDIRVGKIICEGWNSIEQQKCSKLLNKGTEDIHIHRLQRSTSFILQWICKNVKSSSILKYIVSINSSNQFKSILKHIYEEFFIFFFILAVQSLSSLMCESIAFNLTLYGTMSLINYAKKIAFKI